MFLPYRKSLAGSLIGLVCLGSACLLFLAVPSISPAADNTKDLLRELEGATNEEGRSDLDNESDDPKDIEIAPKGESAEPEPEPEMEKPAAPEPEQSPEKDPLPEKEPLPEQKPATAKKSPAFPDFEEVEKVVAQQLNSLRGYEPGDLLTASNVAPVFKELETLGWKVADRKEIEKSFLPENDWLVRQFRTKNGRNFMREIGSNPSGFDRVDRLRNMPYGERQLSDLIQKPGGSKMIEYMVTTPGGKNLGKSLSRGTNGANFNESTGRLYIEKQLLDRLKQSHEAELRKRGQPSSPR